MKRLSPVTQKEFNRLQRIPPSESGYTDTGNAFVIKTDGKYHVYVPTNCTVVKRVWDHICDARWILPVWSGPRAASYNSCVYLNIDTPQTVIHALMIALGQDKSFIFVDYGSRHTGNSWGIEYQNSGWIEIHGSPPFLVLRPRRGRPFVIPIATEHIVRIKQRFNQKNWRGIYEHPKYYPPAPTSLRQRMLYSDVIPQPKERKKGK